MISKATSAKMNYHSAYKYAIAKGLTEDVARNVATVASFYVSQRQSNLYRYY